MESCHRLYPTPLRVSTMVSAHTYQISLQKNYNFGGGVLRVNTLELLNLLKRGGLREPKGPKKRSQLAEINRTEGPNAATLHCQWPMSTAQLVRRMIKEGKTPTPSALFARGHSKEDPKSGKVFIDDRSKALWEKQEAFKVERGIEEGTQEAEKLYYELQADLKSTQEQPDEQKKSVDDQRRQFGKM
ncbi:hypothetical protein Cgig2_023670 [Carnegiea gigantea]|uniref:Uncharacterized protein n=1 Tax=Carnegiea gigantea TaxID=171969 RepID=A0A9Q1KJX2_9CARY|nr:hypothetical protein Cgig2_023670 [Carnegiea gigantea]